MTAAGFAPWRARRLQNWQEGACLPAQEDSSKTDVAAVNRSRP
jgi:hypothetical protein